MKKRVLSILLAGAMVLSLFACAKPAPAEEKKDEPAATEEAAPADDAAPAEEAAGGGTVGVLMPTKSLQRWNQDGDNMKSQLEAAGYTVDLQYGGENDVATQVSQLETMVAAGYDCIVVAPIEGDSLGTPLASAKEAGIPIIAYDRLIMNSDAVSYYATFDNYDVGTKQGQFIEKTLDLANAGDKTYNMEIFTGDPGDNNARFFYGGAMDVLQPYIDAGTIIVPSGQIEFAAVATEGWSTEKAQARMDTILSSNYSDGKALDAVLCSNDSTAMGVANSLAAGFTGDYPIITGQDCDVANMKNLIAGKQSMEIFKDTRALATQVVKMVDAIMQGGTAEVNDTKTYDNGTGIIPTFLCEPISVDIDNYKEILIDSGYYTEDQLAN